MLPDWTGPFLAALAASPNVSGACAAAGISRPTAYDLRRSNAEFADAWQAAIDMGVDDLEGVAFQRAREGSDTLLIFLLKCHRPAVYRDVQAQQHEGEVTIRVVYDDHGQATRAARTDAPAAAAPPGPA